ncbi:MAG: hypothetical protein AB1941_28845, partial [Gemmatimonadota bacterium]
PHPLFCRPVSSPGSIFGPRVETAGAPPTPNSAQWSDFFNSLLAPADHSRYSELAIPRMQIRLAIEADISEMHRIRVSVHERRG